jgi:hypothetical protein
VIDREDDDLRRAFQALRGADAASAPAYADVRARKGVAGFKTPVVLAAASLAAAVLAGLAVVRSPSAQPPIIALEDWRAPTDFLLETPGREILQGVPEIGTDMRIRKDVMP